MDALGRVHSLLYILTNDSSNSAHSLWSRKEVFSIFISSLTLTYRVSNLSNAHLPTIAFGQLRRFSSMPTLSHISSHNLDLKIGFVFNNNCREWHLKRGHTKLGATAKPEWLRLPPGGNWQSLPLPHQVDLVERIDQLI
jgi:hypothetical protein